MSHVHRTVFVDQHQRATLVKRREVERNAEFDRGHGQRTFTVLVVGVEFGDLLLVAAGWYTVFTTVLSIAQFDIERYFARGSARELPPTPIQQLRRRIGELRRRAAVPEFADASTAAIVTETR